MIRGFMMKIPLYLKHKPIYAINDYSKIDGSYKNKSDVAGLSIGKAQWCSGEVFEPSVKVWRKSDKRWSRQSEEITLTRALDMANFVIKILDNYYNSKTGFEITNSVFGNIAIEESGCDTKTIEAFHDFLDKNKTDIDEHIKLLSKTIKSYNE